MALLCLMLLPASARGGTREAAERVRQGITHFQAKQYEQAAKAFAEADVARPDDPWIAFDRACAYAAQGDADKAVERFEQAALSRDHRLAGRSHYNLGVIAAEKARALFGEKPQEASPEVRSEGLALLGRAVGHYRDCLDLDENHTDARHNLELIRLWIKQMQALWQERDRQKQREEMNLLEFLQMLEAEQRALRAVARSIAGQPDSPQRRQALVTTESSQRELAEEIEPLKEKIRAELGAAGEASPGAPQAASPQAMPALSPEAAEKAIQLLTSLANDARQAMFAAADELSGGSATDAVGSQAEAVEKLDQIYQVVVPFPNLVGRAIATEQGLIDQVAPAVENPDEAESLDSDESAWTQRLVAGWAEALAPKAEQGLKGLENFDPSAMAPPPGGAPQPGGPNAQTLPDAEAMKKQIEGLKQSMQKAVELGPKIHDLADEAATHLEEEEPVQALPKQEEALKLLKEIADSLPQQDQQQQGDEQQDQQQGDQKQQQQPSGQDQEQPQREPRDLSKRQAESVLRKARERQRERRDMQKQLDRQMYRPGAVEKDW